MPTVEVASPVSTDEAPMPRKKTTIMPRRLQWSPSQPAGRVPAPKAMKPQTESVSSSP